jgi:hypothetical protein
VEDAALEPAQELSGETLGAIVDDMRQAARPARWTIPR